jgi:hypothetical protein
VPSTTVIGHVTAKGTGGAALTLTVKLSARVRSLLAHGHTVRASAHLTYTSIFGGTPGTHLYRLTIHGRKRR